MTVAETSRALADRVAGRQPNGRSRAMLGKSIARLPEVGAASPIGAALDLLARYEQVNRS
jgi:hypothetical protein